MEELLNDHLEEIRRTLLAVGIVLDTEVVEGDRLLLLLTQPAGKGPLWNRREMIQQLRTLLPAVEPPPRVKATPHRKLTLDRTEDGSVLLRQLTGKYLTVEVRPGRGEHEFFVWVTGEQRWFHLTPLPGEEVRARAMERFAGSLRRWVGEEWVRGVLGDQ